MRKLKTNELNRLSVSEFKNTPKNKVVIVLDNVRSLHNVGSIFRTSDAFSVEKIMLCGITGTPPHREIRKTAIGAENSVNWQYYPTTQDAIDELGKDQYKIIAVEQTTNSIPLAKDNLPNLPIALIFGINGFSK